MPDPVASGSKNGATDETPADSCRSIQMFWAAAGDAPQRQHRNGNCKQHDPENGPAGTPEWHRAIPPPARCRWAAARGWRSGQPPRELTSIRAPCAQSIQSMKTLSVNLYTAVRTLDSSRTMTHARAGGFTQAVMVHRSSPAIALAAPQSQVSAWRGVTASRSRSRKAVASCCAGVGVGSPGGSACWRHSGPFS